MQVRIEDVSPVEKKLIVEVPWKTVDNRLTAAYRELGRSVQLRGFRKGKVPRSVLQRMYGKHVRAEVTSQLVRESFVTAATEHKLQAVSEPRLDNEPDIKKGQPLSFEAIVEVKGEVVAEDYLGMELARPRVEVSDEQIDAALAQLQEENAELLPIEGRDITARTDFLTIRVTGTVGDQEVDRPKQVIDLSSPEQEPLPGLIEALTGLPIDVQDHAIELAIPEDFPDPDIAGKTAALTISILDASRKEKPVLDDEFAKDLDRGETLQELRDDIRASIEKQQHQAADQALRKRALSALVERNPIPVAQALVERGMKFQLERLQMMMGMPAGEHGLELTDKMRESLQPSALEEVRGELLLEAVANQESIQIEDTALDERIAEMAERSHMPAAKMRAELIREGQLEHLEYQLKRDKTLDFLIEKAVVSDEVPGESVETGEGAGEAGTEAAGAGAEATEIDAEAGSQPAGADAPADVPAERPESGQDHEPGGEQDE